MNKLIITLLAAFSVSLTAQTTNLVSTNVVKLPEMSEFPVAWEHNTEDEIYQYRLYRGIVAVKLFATNEYVITGKTGLLTYFKATVPATVPKGTNMLTVSAVNEVNEQSDPSNILPTKMLGKPVPPQALRKP